MKIVLKILLLLVITGYIVFAVVKFAKPTEDYTCVALDIEIVNEGEVKFITTEYVRNLLNVHDILIEGQKLNEIDIENIEDILTTNPYIRDANVYFTAANHVSISVKPEQPVLHVILDNEDYYLDENGTTMPIDTFNLDLCVATGNITKDFASNNLIVLAGIITHDEYWKEQIEQIHVTDEEHIELYPKKGEHSIEIGGTDNLEEKFQRLKTFYDKGLSIVGWNKYKTINVSYKGQVIGVKRDEKINKH